MFRHAITRRPGRSLVQGLSTSGLGPPDHEHALEQHARYVGALRACGMAVCVLPEAEAYPDSVFVEDAAICTPRCAVLTRPGAPSRRDEPALLEHALRGHYAGAIARIEPPGTLDGGDVLVIGSYACVGLSARSNRDGGRQLLAILGRHGMTGSLLQTGDHLHLKTGFAYLENGNLLAADGIDVPEELSWLEVTRVPAEESYAANSVWVNGRVVMPDGCPRTRSAVEALGYEVLAVDTSEYRKLDGGVSCLSLRF
jgi:dimethylargininase